MPLKDTDWSPDCFFRGGLRIRDDGPLSREQISAAYIGFNFVPPYEPDRRGNGPYTRSFDDVSKHEQLKCVDRMRRDGLIFSRCRDFYVRYRECMNDLDTASPFHKRFDTSYCRYPGIGDDAHVYFRPLTENVRDKYLSVAKDHLRLAKCDCEGLVNAIESVPWKSVVGFAYGAAIMATMNIAIQNWFVQMTTDEDYLIWYLSSHANQLFIKESELLHGVCIGADGDYTIRDTD